MHRLFSLLGPVLAILIALAAIPAVPAVAQAGERCFAETGFCISGPIRTYWERGGGLPVFGFPITAQTAEAVEGLTLQVQWFERDRLEIQPNGLVTAGRLGAERLEQLGSPWQPGPNTPAGPDCAAFSETGHQVCGAFLSYWRANGGLERFGLPLTGEFVTELEGRPYTVQYFERRRFELHPEIRPNAVLLGLLGREVFTSRQGGTPAPQPPALPAPTGAVVVRSQRSYIQEVLNVRYVVGEVENNTQATAYGVKISARFYNGAGQLVATEDGYALLDRVDPGQRAPFRVMLLNSPPDIARIDLSVASRATTILNYRPVTVVSQQTRESYGFEVFGEVRNDSGAPLKGVKVVVSFYDDAGEVVDVDAAYVSSADLAPGAGSPYSIKTFDTDLQFASFQVRAEGYIAP